MEAITKERRMIFMSHKSTDRDLAIRFKDELVSLGFKDAEVFLAEEIPPGEEWSREILEALVSSHYSVIAVYGSQS